MITSKSNPQVKQIRLLRLAKYRQEGQEYFVEGIKLTGEALQEPEGIKKIVYSPRLEKNIRGAELLSQLRQKVSQAEWLYVSDEVLDKMSDTQSHQGILAVIKIKKWTWEEILPRGSLLLLFHRIQDPGNLGTIFRVAEAGGVAGLILSSNTVDPFSPKTVRSSMGSIFRLPFLVNQDIKKAVNKLQTLGYKIWATSAAGSISFWEVDFSKPSAVILGQEGGGLPENLIKTTQGSIIIPMKSGVESLNVAMAAGLIVYEAWRQKIKN
ncbi:MAG: TrmH family RNA methyltransferase [Thermodesulfobacteriota bacterium]